MIAERDTTHLPTDLVVMEYEPTERFHAIARHTAVARPDGSLIAVTGPADDVESARYARAFALAPRLFTVCESLIATNDAAIRGDYFGHHVDYYAEVKEQYATIRALVAAMQGEHKDDRAATFGRATYDQDTQRWMAVWDMGGVAFDSGPLQFATEAQAAQYAVATRQQMLDEAE